MGVGESGPPPPKKKKKKNAVRNRLSSAICKQVKLCTIMAKHNQILFVASLRHGGKCHIYLMLISLEHLVPWQPTISMVYTGEVLVNNTLR